MRIGKALGILMAGWFLLAGMPLLGQDETEGMLNNLARNFDKLDRFSVDATIKVEVDFIKIKDRLVKIKFEKPDKFSFESDGLALLPKNGLQLEYLSLIQKGYTSLPAGQEDLEGVRTHIIKVIPESDTEDIILAQMWIDPVANRILKMKTYTKKSGSYVIEFKYGKTPFNLPDQTTVNFDISALTIPAKVMSEFHPQGGKVKEGPSQAKVTILYTNYKINQ